MKTAIYVEDGVTQIVLTPVTAFEREVLARITREEIVQVRMVKGAFRRDPEGWQRFGATLDGETHEQCLMLRLGSEVAGDCLTSTDGLDEDGLIRDVPMQVDVSRQHTFRPRDL